MKGPVTDYQSFCEYWRRQSSCGTSSSVGGGGGGGGNDDNKHTKKPSALPTLQRSLSKVDNNKERGPEHHHHQTTTLETHLHLIKGYIGAGCLSLPWAISRLGLGWGLFSLCVLNFWTSYNCWTVVKIKRYLVEKTATRWEEDERPSDAKSIHSVSSSNITYPDVGEFLYGRTFRAYTSTCICVQQMAICTVFLSFVGENVLAVLHRIGCPWGWMASHTGVMTIVLPAALLLSFIPTLKQLAPVIAAGAVSLLSAFVVLGGLIAMKWEDRPTELPTLDIASVPVSLCAILYSFEGICLILPIESAMKHPQHFPRVFWTSMTVVCVLVGFLAAICVVTFGAITNGSITAFLLDQYRNDESITAWLMLANTVVSLSVLFTYPLMLFPALELLGPTLEQWWKGHGVKPGGGTPDEDNDLEGFEPLPPLPEDRVPSHESITEMLHRYEWDNSGDPRQVTDNILVSVSASLNPPNDNNSITNNDDKSERESLQTIAATIRSLFPTMTMPGDSPQLRAGLVLSTYLIAVIVPNVHTLISLAGALAGASTGLLIPPILELAWIRELEGDNSSVEHPNVDRTSYHNHISNSDITMNNRDFSQQWKRLQYSARRGFAIRRRSKFWSDKLKSYLLLVLGTLFFVVGTYASLADIIQYYRTKK